MSNPEFRRHRLRLAIPVVVAAILLGGYTVLWFQGAKVMRSEIAAWTASERAMGRSVAHGDIAIRGYPGSLRAEIEVPAWSDPGEWTWQADRLFVIAQPFAPKRLVLTPRGEQRATYGDAVYDLRAETMKLGLEEGFVAVEAAGVTAEGGGRSYELGALRLNWSENDDGSAVLGLSAGQVGMTQASGEGIVIPQLNAALSEEAEGDLGLDAFEGAIGATWDEKPALLSGEGRVAIGQDGYPSGRMTVTVREASALADALVGLGVVDASQADMAVMLVGGMSDANGQAELPFVLSNGQVKIGPLAIAELPRFALD